jgi:alanyl-tRNA synthetase
MEKLGLNEIRERFLSFYQTKGHYRANSYSLIPDHDKSLLIINSGMAPLKPFFSGEKTPPAPRMTTCQKCIRTADLENVGHTARHGTFFEMMGNFSFGDYFKKESLTWGWEFLTKVLNLPVDRLWATVYLDDDEAYNIWKNDIGLPEERIVRLGKEDNFWEIGTGPCGPCSEIYFDRGEEYGCGKPDCKPGCECDRYVEFWNHVFTQFDNKGDGTYTDLAHKNIDTGMGLERIACIMQGTDSIFDVDTIKHVLDEVSRISGVTYQDGAAKTDVSIRIITDHIRSAVFMIGDMIMPGNEGRGYVLKRIIRRAVRHGRLLGIDHPFLADLSTKVIEVCGGAYPELEEQRVFIQKILANEEEKFLETLQQGMDIIDQYLADGSGSGQMDGEIAFRLYDTYGFPYEMTEEICEEHGWHVDREGFDAAMARQKAAGKKDAAAKDFAWKKNSLQGAYEGTTTFTGYDKVQDTGIVQMIFDEEDSLPSLEAGRRASLIVDQTPFYAESGGQVADYGMIYTDDFAGEVVDVQKANEVWTLTVDARKGILHAGDQIRQMISEPVRNATARNHTATHLLQQALVETLGSHVKQAGSLVTKDRLRFDFNHFEAMTKEQIAQVEKIVNDKIDMFLPVTTRIMKHDEAVNSDARGLFEDKYGDEVRVVSIGDYSKELCGGTHVKNAGQIGAFHILSESGIASGVRRIEAVTGRGVLTRLEHAEEEIGRAAGVLKAAPEQLAERTSRLSEENRALKKELEKLTAQSLHAQVDEMLASAKDVHSVHLITRKFDEVPMDDLRSLSDDIKAGRTGYALVLASVAGGKVTFLCSLTDDLVKKGYHAGKMIKEIARAAGGGGGGKPDMAQAGAKDPSKVEAAFATAEKLLQTIV